jgi:hypothetical protein
MFLFYLDSPLRRTTTRARTEPSGIAHRPTDWNGIGRDVPHHVRDASCNFMAKKYKTEYRTSTNRLERNRSRHEMDVHTLVEIPNEDFGRSNQRFRMRFPVNHFQGSEYSIWAKNRWKVLHLETHSETLVRPSKIFV